MECHTGFGRCSDGLVIVCWLAGSSYNEIWKCRPLTCPLDVYFNLQKCRLFLYIYLYYIQYIIYRYYMICMYVVPTIR